MSKQNKHFLPTKLKDKKTILHTNTKQKNIHKRQKNDKQLHAERRMRRRP